jgi:prephenate dehydratase
MEKKRIAIQGGYGAFHDIAAMHYFGQDNIEVVPRNTFKDIFMMLNDNHADFGIMAIENSLAGSILPNYSLLKESGARIMGEIYLRIELNLVALPGQDIQEIQEVYSHPMAILQSQSFFDDFPHIRLIDSADTALSAGRISEKGLRGVAAISSQYAAEKYNLEVMYKGIEMNKKNYTRFLIVKEGTEEVENPNKSSIHFSLAHRIGSLSKILSIFSFHDINLTKIQSMPIIGRDWEYQFYIDLEFDDRATYLQALEGIKPFTGEFGQLGEYKKGETILC